MNTENCPFCLNKLNAGATACGHCGAFMAQDNMGVIRQVASLAWVIIGLLLAWGLESVWPGLIIAAIAVFGVVIKPKIQWVKQ